MTNDKQFVRSAEKTFDQHPLIYRRGVDAFEQWEAREFGDDSPLSDLDRDVWIAGFVAGFNSLYRQEA
jgi:hypothetical protein